MSSLILRTAMGLILPLALVFAAYVALKGHNLPGGGFIGGLIAATVLSLYRMSNGREAFERMLPIHPRVLVFVGLALAFLTALTPIVFGRGVLTSLVTDLHIPVIDLHLHFASAMIFDAGVVLVVIGVSVGMIARLSEELETP